MGLGIKWHMLQLRQLLRLSYYKTSYPELVTDAYPFKPVWIDAWKVRLHLNLTCFDTSSLPKMIKLTPSKRRFCSTGSAGFVLSGLWSDYVTDYCPEKSLLYSALKSRCTESSEWFDTEWFNSVSSKVRSGQCSWNGCTNQNDIINRCIRADKLIKSIQKNGFLHKIEPVLINIGPKGEFISNGNGQHRIMLGMIFNSKVPVQVVVRHAKWQLIRNEYKEKQKNIVNAYSYHPDLMSLSVNRCNYV